MCLVECECVLVVCWDELCAVTVKSPCCESRFQGTRGELLARGHNKHNGIWRRSSAHAPAPVPLAQPQRVSQAQSVQARRVPVVLG